MIFHKTTFLRFSSENSDKANQRSRRGLQVRESKEFVSGAHSDLYILKDRKIGITRTLRFPKQILKITHKTTFLRFFFFENLDKPNQRSTQGLQVRESKEFFVSGTHSDIYILKYRKLEVKRILRSPRQIITKTKKTSILFFFFV